MQSRLTRRQVRIALALGLVFGISWIGISARKFLATDPRSLRRVKKTESHIPGSVPMADPDKPLDVLERQKEKAVAHKVRKPLEAQAKRRVDPWADLRVHSWAAKQNAQLQRIASGYQQPLTEDLMPIRTPDERHKLCDKLRHDPWGVYSLNELLQGAPGEYGCKLSIMGNLCRDPPEAVMKLKKDSVSAPRVMCWLLSSIRDKRKDAIRATWGSRCDFIIYAAASDSNFPTLGLPVPDDRMHIASKAVAMWTYIYLHFLDQFDFFIKADPDTYVVYPNLKEFVKDKDPELPLYYGNQFHIQDIPWWRYASGGPGEVLSRGAVRVLVEHAYRKHCGYCIPDGQCEDCKLARCFNVAGVNISDSRDKYGRERFLSQGPGYHLLYPEKSGMYEAYNLWGGPHGHDCCSEYPISFHYVKPEGLYLLDYLFHRWKVASYDEPSFDSYEPIPRDMRPPEKL